jgi:hypothetical protein
MTRTLRRLAVGAVAAAAIAAPLTVTAPASAQVYLSNGRHSEDDKAFNCFTDGNEFCGRMATMPSPARFHRHGQACVGDSYSIMCEDGHVLWFGDGSDRKGEIDRAKYRRHLHRLTSPR